CWPVHKASHFPLIGFATDGQALIKSGKKISLPGAFGADALLQVAPMRRAKGPASQTMTCPDCGLALRAIGGSPGFKIVYDKIAWRRVCTRVHLGDPAWCLIQRDGTHPPHSAMDGGERGSHNADLVIIGSHCVGLKLIIERLQVEGLSVKVVTVGSSE